MSTDEPVVVIAHWQTTEAALNTSITTAQRTTLKTTTGHAIGFMGRRSFFHMSRASGRS